MRRDTENVTPDPSAPDPELTGETEPASAGRGGKKRRPMAPEERAIFRSIALLALTVFIDLFGFGIVLPNLPQYVEAATGRNHEHAAFIGGLLAASYSLTQFLCAPFWGSLSDRVGRRPIILTSLLGIAVSYTLFGFSNGHLWMLFAARLLAGLLSSASIGVAFAYVADVTTPKNRAMGMGLLGACFGLGFAFGPVLGGILGHIALSLPAFVAAGMAIVNFGMSWFSLPESLTKEAREKLAQTERLPYFQLMRLVVRDPAAPLFVVTFILTFGFAAIEQAFGYFLMARHIASPGNQQVRMAYLLGFVGVLGIILQGGLVGPLSKRFGEGNLIRAGLAILAIGYWLLMRPTGWGVEVFVATGFVGVGRSMIGPTASALISRKTKIGQGLILSSSQGFDALARTVGPVTAGTLFQQFGALAPYKLSGVLTLFAFAVTFLLPHSVSAPQDGDEGAAIIDKEPVSSTA